MDERERKELITDVASSVKTALDLHGRANGHVTRSEFNATKEVLRQGMDSIGRAVEGVHRDVKEQRKSIDGLTATTNELKVDLATHVSRHKGEEAAEERVARDSDARVRDKTYWAKAAMVVLALIGMLAGAAVYIDGKIDGIKDMVAGGKAGP